MFKNNLQYYKNYLLIEKDEEIENNFLYINDLFITKLNIVKMK